jgi:hypothetical protein
VNKKHFNHEKFIDIGIMYCNILAREGSSGKCLRTPSFSVMTGYGRVDASHVDNYNVEVIARIG